MSEAAETPQPRVVETNSNQAVPATSAPEGIRARIRNFFRRGGQNKEPQVTKVDANASSVLSRDEAVDRMTAAAMGTFPTTPLPEPGVQDKSPDKTAA